jgi:hypothetical protein
MADLDTLGVALLIEALNSICECDEERWWMATEDGRPVSRHAGKIVPDSRTPMSPSVKG